MAKLTFRDAEVAAIAVAKASAEDYIKSFYAPIDNDEIKSIIGGDCRYVALCTKQIEVCFYQLYLKNEIVEELDKLAVDCIGESEDAGEIVRLAHFIKLGRLCADKFFDVYNLLVPFVTEE